MYVLDCLARVFTRVCNHAEAVFSNAEFDREFCRDFKHMGDKRAVCFVNAEHGFNVRLGNYENMNGSLGLEVIKGNNLFILINLF